MRSSPGSDGALRAKVRPASENSPHPPHVLYRYGIVTLSLFGASRPAARAQRRMRVHPRSNHESYRLVQDVHTMPRRARTCAAILSGRRAREYLTELAETDLGSRPLLNMLR
eukprot:5503253-Pyramimonas_sp.AAC.4